MPETAEILDFLGCPPEKPGIRPLNRLIGAYVHKVPWESVFRICKRASTPDLLQRPRWPAEFWRDAIASGGGGTCFENNYAFFSLLRSLGYSGYLTVNDMGAERGCHSAIILLLAGRKYLVDTGIPLLAALPVDSGRTARKSTWLHTYSVRPDGENRYQILRSRHPKPNIYTLLDTPVSEDSYRETLTSDYGSAGLFLDQVIIVKVIGRRLWRFSSRETPFRIESFGPDGRQVIPIPHGQAASLLAETFGMRQDRIEEAFRSLR